VKFEAAHDMVGHVSYFDIVLLLPQPCEWAGFAAGRHSFTIV
jgi:hypothetical protein